METALEGLKEGRIPTTQQLGTFLDIQAAVGFPVRRRMGTSCGQREIMAVDLTWTSDLI
jgi:hypothetical protein